MNSVYPGQSWEFIHGGHRFRADIAFDGDSREPWRETDGNIPVQRVAHDYGSHYGPDKKPGDFVFYRGNRGDYSYCVNIPDALRIAKRDSWGINAETRAKFLADKRREPTAREIAVLAVNMNIEFMRRWCADEWCWIGVTVTHAASGESDSLWGVESFGEYAREEIAPELAENLLCDRRKAWRKALSDRREIRYFENLARAMVGIQS